MATIEELAEDWLALDKDPETRDEIYRLLQQGNKQELELRLRTRITFGTAGLRARMEAGFSRLNSLTVIQTSQGLAAYLLKHVPDAKHKGVVIGRDARHNSLKFAKLAAAAFVAMHIKVWWLELETHTPMVPFGVQELNAAAGVMITASHNPAKDNGYKVYWENSCQIIPPHDTGIAESIMENLEPLTWDTSVVDQDDLRVEGCLGRVRGAYYEAIKILASPVEPPADFRFVYTPMHGVGLPFMKEAADNLNVGHRMVVVRQQADPDPDFPTVKFPNPEEKGALDLAMKTADREDVSLIIATDPDADRFAFAEKVDGRWHTFTGNEVGILLASYVLSTYNGDRQKLAMLASTVSSRMLASMAEVEGFHFEETLTGFKWLGNRAQELDKRGYQALFAFEEAIGYMFTTVVWDKDGVTAASNFLVAAVQWQKEEDRTPYQKLQQLYEKYGYFADANTYLISPSPDATKAAFDKIRSLGKPYPTSLGGKKITRWRDLTVGYDSGAEDNIPELPVQKDSQMITCELDNGVRFTVRGSGTEPKIKLYVECKADSHDEAQARAKEVADAIVDEWFGSLKGASG